MRHCWCCCSSNCVGIVYPDKDNFIPPSITLLLAFPILGSGPKMRFLWYENGVPRKSLIKLKLLNEKLLPSHWESPCSLPRHSWHWPASVKQLDFWPPEEWNISCSWSDVTIWMWTHNFHVFFIFRNFLTIVRNLLRRKKNPASLPVSNSYFREEMLKATVCSNT